MEKYTKHNSNYIRTKRHQNLKDGSTIFERDWVTIGSQLHFGAGKTPYYTNGNFIFTTSPTPNYQKKHKNGKTLGEWNYRDVENATNEINNICVDEYTEDIRTFVYYGSCVELIRSSVEHIINTFPGNITLSTDRLILPPETPSENYEYIEGHIINNPFQIDLITTDVELGKEDNPLRFLSYSYKDYTINDYKITSYVVEWKDDYDYDCPRNNDYEIKRDYVVKVNIRDTEENEHILFGYKSGNNMIFCYRGDKLEIKPSKEHIDNYFVSLKGFEKQLLYKQSKPLYTSVFITPQEEEWGYSLIKRAYTWPSKDYCIDITSTQYLTFLDNLTEMATIYDEVSTDNVWRRMTHEAIKNYDWTYTREYEEGEEEDNIDGGERMRKVINVIGRVFDDIKLYIDKIKLNNRITYNGDRNIPNAQLSDKLELSGWEVFSTIPVFFEEDKTVTKPISNQTLEGVGDWYPTKECATTTVADVDVEFMRRMILSSKRILSTKGTRNAIGMVMGMFGYCEEKDYTITETYNTVTPKKYDDPFEITESAYEELSDEAKANYELSGNVYKHKTLSFGDKIVELNYKKENELLYDEDASGIPVGSFIEFKENNNTLTPVSYLIPFYDCRKFYDGNFCFQSKGGWSYNSNDIVISEINDYAWEETVSYLRVVSDIEGLLSVNANEVKNGDIYYVVNLGGIANYTESDLVKNKISNFFVLVDDFNPELFASWVSLDMTNESSEYEYAEYVKKAKYLDSIIPSNIGNNPHVGYGAYDLGNEYFDYMKKPFKYAIENGEFDGDSEIEANEIGFNITTVKTKTDNNGRGKIKIVKKTNESNNDNYYLNNKAVYIKNKISNIYYKRYFKEIIVKYLMQVIPSTTIIVLVGF